MKIKSKMKMLIYLTVLLYCLAFPESNLNYFYLNKNFIIFLKVSIYSYG